MPRRRGAHLCAIRLRRPDSRPPRSQLLSSLSLSPGDLLLPVSVTESSLKETMLLKMEACPPTPLPASLKVMRQQPDDPVPVHSQTVALALRAPGRVITPVNRNPLTTLEEKNVDSSYCPG